MPNVTVYTLPVCVQCDRTKKLLDREGIEYETVDLTTVPDVAAAFKEEGFMQAPIVIAGEVRWSGFRPDLVKELSGPVEA